MSTDHKKNTDETVVTEEMPESPQAEVSEEPFTEATEVVETSTTTSEAVPVTETVVAEPHLSPSEAEDTIATLQVELEDLRLRLEEAEKKTLYAQAEFLNYRRRKEEESASMLKYSTGELIKGLLPVVDNFERALKASEHSRNFDALIGGVSGTLKQFQTFLQKAGVTPIEALGKEFDPNYHEAIGHTETDEFPTNTVAEEIQRGYILHDRVLRPTLVKVSG